LEVNNLHNGNSSSFPPSQQPKVSSTKESNHQQTENCNPLSQAIINSSSRSTSPQSIIDEREEGGGGGGNGRNLKINGNLNIGSRKRKRDVNSRKQSTTTIKKGMATMQLPAELIGILPQQQQQPSTTEEQLNVFFKLNFWEVINRARILGKMPVFFLDRPDAETFKSGVILLKFSF